MTELRQDSSRLERWLARALVVATIAAAVLTVAAAFILTLGFDEAWVLLGIDGILHPAPAGMAVAPVLSNGGLHAFAQLAVTAVAGRAVWAHRLVNVFCLAAIVALIVQWARRRDPDRSWSVALLAPAVLLGLPGSLVAAATAYGTVPAFLLLLATARLWDAAGERRWLRWFGCGALAGLAAATRSEVVLLLPALVIAAFWRREGRAARVADAIVTVAIGAVVMALAIVALTHAAPPAARVDPALISQGTGLSLAGLIDYPRWLNKWVIAESFMPLALLALGTLIVGHVDGERNSAVAILLACGWLIWIAWLLRSPVAHLRYLWPAMACFAVVLGLGLTRLHAWGVRERQPAARVAAWTIALACLVSGLGSTVRAVAEADTNILSWEWSRETRMDYFRRFQHAMDQRAAARYVGETTAADDTLGVIGLDMELRYLTGRRIVALETFTQGDTWRDPASLPRRLVIPPMVGRYLYLNADGEKWIEENCTLDAQCGGYAFYRVKGTYPPDARTLQLTVVQPPIHPLTKAAWGN